ncbi:hypothetical protein ES707_21867 [subsurface metagenome]
MAQAAYQPNEIRDMADLLEELSGIKVNLEFVKYDEQHEKVVASAVAPIPTYDVFSLDLIWTQQNLHLKVSVLLLMIT